MRKAMIVALALGLGLSWTPAAAWAEQASEKTIQMMVEKARLSLKLAELRLERARGLARQGRHEALREELESYRKAVEACLEDLQEASSMGAGLEKAIEQVERATQHHGEVLSGLLEKVPEQARPAIEHALEVSQKGRKTALAALQAIKRGERPCLVVSAGRPCPEGSPSKAKGPKALPAQAKGKKEKVEKGGWKRYEFSDSETPATSTGREMMMEERPSMGMGLGLSGPSMGLGSSMGKGSMGRGMGRRGR
jgi:hypothetical protein